MWEQRYVFDAVDVYAWGRHVDDLHARNNVRLAILVHVNGAMCMCISGSQADDMSVLELRHLLAGTSSRRPSPRLLTYRKGAAGLNITFPDCESLEFFREITAALPPTPITPLSRPPLSVDDLLYFSEEDITAAYHRSFGPTRLYESWDYLFEDGHPDGYTEAWVRRGDTPSAEPHPRPDTGACLLDVEWPIEDDESGWDMSSQTGSQPSDLEFYDAIESPECSWFELD
ncbi:hypothetical protein BD414DRAFT_541104 [Trametes punicea]|nr:hypothetical protein BD414DRAFT_541104 [Trametes punicea]